MCQKQDFDKIFSSFGALEKLSLIENKNEDPSLNHGFVIFREENAAEVAFKTIQNFIWPNKIVMRLSWSNDSKQKNGEDFK